MAHVRIHGDKCNHDGEMQSLHSSQDLEQLASITEAIASPHQQRKSVSFAEQANDDGLQ